MPKSKRAPIDPSVQRHVKHPWPVVFTVLFFVLLAGMLFLLVYGTPPAYESFTRGYIGLYMAPNELGQIALAPQPEGGAINAGVENGDILLAVDDRPLLLGEDPNELLRGRVGEPVTITVQKADGREETYTIVRSGNYQATLEQAGLTADILAYYFIGLSALRFLVFAGAGIFVLLRRPQDWLFVLAAFALLLFPVGFNYADLVSNGATILGVGWVIFLVRALGIFLALSLLLLFPNGEFSSDWARLLLIVAVFWMVPYISAQFLTDFISANKQTVVWVLFFLCGIGFQVYRLLRVATEDDVWQARPAVIALLVFVAAFLIIKGLFFLPADTFADAGWTWFYMLTALPVDAALVTLAVNLARSMRRVAE